MIRGSRNTPGQAQHLEWIAGSTHTILLDSEATQGRLTLLRTEFRRGAASPVHVHDREDETLYVLSGSAVAWVGRDRWELTAGDTVFMPRGVAHTYLITSDVCEMVTACTPGGIEEFFRSAGWDLSRPRPADWEVDLAGLTPLGEQLGQHVLGPPLTDPTASMPAHAAGVGDDGKVLS